VIEFDRSEKDHSSRFRVRGVFTQPGSFATAQVSPRLTLTTVTPWERQRHQERAARVKAVLNVAGLPVIPSDTHIVPVLVGDARKYKAAMPDWNAELVGPDRRTQWSLTPLPIASWPTEWAIAIMNQRSVLISVHQQFDAKPSQSRQ
jgi:7-keto-8-aminopelargonate synthetase-like enzyme